MKKLVVFVALFFLIVTAHAEQGSKCSIVHWHEGDVITVTASLNKATHITFPENNTDVIVGNNELWDVDFTHNHVWIKPNTVEKDGSATTVSYVGESNTSYEMYIKRKTGNHPICYIVKKPEELVNKQSWNKVNKPDSPVVANRIAIERQRRATNQIIKQTRDALSKYRKSIFTGYLVNEGEGWFSNNGELVSSVYDDGRFTYIRVLDDSRGLMSVFGMIDGKQELLESEYDPATKMYEVSGVFPEFTMRAGDSEVLIKRD
jgi:type IV secretory pathway VirB9-like protein